MKKGNHPDYMNRRKFISRCSQAGVAAAITSTSLKSAYAASSDCASDIWSQRSDRREQVVSCLALDRTEILRQDQLRSEGLLEVEPVLMAGAGETPYGHQHLGWPVAVMVEDTLIAAVKTWAGKEWQSRGEIPGRGPILLYSDDGGRSWSKPYYPNGHFGIELKYPEREGMLALGATRSGKVVFVYHPTGSSSCSHVFISADKGRSWTWHRVEGLRGRGPRIIEHPDYGLILPGDTRNELRFYVSKDEGHTWKEVRLPLDEKLFRPAEPTAFILGKQFGLLVRNHSGPSTGSYGYFRTWSYFASCIPTNASSATSFEDLNFSYKLTNIWAGRRMDTNDVVYNTYTNRIEAITTKRNEGFPYSDYHYLTLNLWSMDPRKFFSGHTDWRFECVLLRSKGKKSRSTHPEFPPRDGMHPAGSVIDEKRGVQHVFIYSGDRAHLGPDRGQTGVFRITRSLDTEQLCSRCRELDHYEKKFRVHEEFETLQDWTPSGRPVMLWVGDEQGDRDVIRKLSAPMPRGKVIIDEQGLFIGTEMPGYYGLHNEKAIVIHNYRITFKARIQRYAANGDSLGIAIHYGAQKQQVFFRKDGLYSMERPEVVRKMAGMNMDHEWHVWSLIMKAGNFTVYRDGMYLAEARAMIDDRLGYSDTPLAIFVRTTSESDPVEMRMKYFKLENMEEDACG